MAASTSDHFRKASSGTRPVVANLASPKSNGSTTAVLNVATGWNTTTGVDVVIYRTNTSGKIVAGTQTDWIATLAGTTLSGMVLKAGTEPSTGYPQGSQSVVIATPTAAWGDSLVDGLLISHDQDGTLKAGAVDNTAVIADGIVTGPKLAAGAATTAKIADDAITAQKLLNGQVYRRQGGSATDWASSGTTAYDTSALDVKIQVGRMAGTGNNSDANVTFPVAFTNTPLIIATPYGSAGAYPTWYIVSESNTGFTFRIGVNVNAFEWIAIGI